MSIGRIYVIKKLCSEAFDEVRAFLFQANKIISQSSDISEIIRVSEILTALNSVCALSTKKCNLFY